MLSELGIKRTFHKVFFGASLTVARRALSHIQALGYVKMIHLDHEVKISLNESVPR